MRECQAFGAIDFCLWQGHKADAPRHAAAKLITASGFAPVGVGGLDQSLRIEAFGELSEYGKLGKLVTKLEAEAIVNKAPGLQLKSA